MSETAAEPGSEVKVIDRRWWAQGEPASDVPGDWQPRKPTYVEELEQRLADKDAELRDVIARYRAASQEFEATRVRARRDVLKEVEREKRVILTELLDVVDNLDRALEAAQGGATVEALRQGVEMVRDMFLSRLEGFGVRRMPALDERFDPARHEAATVVPVTGADHDGRVVGVIRQGYLVGDEVLRPAMVAVGQRADSA